MYFFHEECGAHIYAFIYLDEIYFRAHSDIQL